MSFVLTLLATPKAVPELRHRLRDHTHDVRLCVSELVTNVIDHLGEGTPVTVRVTGTPCGRTRVEVTDPDPRVLPVLLRATATDESGRGIALLDALTHRWGVEQGADRKTVWCELGGTRQRPGQDTESQPGRLPTTYGEGYLTLTTLTCRNTRYRSRSSTCSPSCR
ncbi:ATP-binding protein [Streptomyces sp. GQFP]|uniref:ATP-binding protein n=1 Tax=Streptomyces sp. GQFP TaxID=2907545 RepID=UPI001F1A535F|nr:ATP-binding protein [Streptomyces sp. GQFP]UIX31204.1 ATP-binding protein [Streptomyces sp. GQFP]